MLEDWDDQREDLGYIMKVICKKKIIEDLELKKLTTHLVNNYGYTLEIGREYLIMGMVIYKEVNYLHYLIDHNGSPYWLPYTLFDISDNNLSMDWHTNIFGETEGGDLSMLMGFYELCNDDDFYDLLIDRDYEATSVYFRRKMEVEKMELEKKDIPVGLIINQWWKKREL